MPTFHPKKLFTLSGSNMNFTRRIMFGREEVDEFEYLDKTGISGVVPAAAYTEELTIETNADTLSLGVQQVVLDAASQLVVSGLQKEDVSGQAGKLITLTGENFYQITDVNFGDISGDFNVISPSEIEARVPQNADFGKVTVFSSLRTGLAGNISKASGITVNEFVPIPEVTGLSSNQLVTGETLTIQGSSLSGVTGVTVNDIEFNSISVPNSTGVEAEVPSGYVSGVPVLGLKSGLSYSCPNNFQFNPLALVTGVAEGVERGGLLTISGQNFDSGIMHSGQEYDRYMVAIGNTTGNFKILDGKRMSGVVPTDFFMNVSGGNLQAGSTPTVSSGLVTVFSTNFPEEYPSSEYYTPAVGTPTITSINPVSGIPGDTFVISGTNLFAVTGVDLNGIGFGTTTPSVAELVVGDSLIANIPDGSDYTFPMTGEELYVKISGYFGNATSPTSYNVLGRPNPTSVIPDTAVMPGSTGTVYGTRLYSGTTLTLRNTSAAPAGFLSDLEISGYLNDEKEIVFRYPNAFSTGYNFKIRAHNRRTQYGLLSVAAIREPFISGFTPLSGEFGDNVNVSGYFETIKPSGLMLGDNVITEFTQTLSSGIDFKIPLNSRSDVITVDTSGGLATTSGVLGVSASKPSISGYYVGAGPTPASFDYDQVMVEGQFATITGSRLNLVTGIHFTGVADTINMDTFWQKRPSSLVFNVPPGIHTGDGSGLFELKDFKGRTTSSSTVSASGVNIASISGFNENIGPGRNFTVSGYEINGLDVLFTDYKNEDVVATPVSTSGPGISGMCTVTVQVPTGIVEEGNIRLTGRSNQEGVTSSVVFSPLPTITGISGFTSSNEALTGTSITITGLNANTVRPQTNIEVLNSGVEYWVGITGTGTSANKAQAHLYTAYSIATGSGVLSSPNCFYSRFGLDLDSRFIGTGQFFLLPPSEGGLNASDDLFQISDIATGGYLPSQVSYFPGEYIINGTRVDATGFGPTRGVTGQNVLISGAGFNEVTGVFFQIPSGEPLSSDFTINSDNKITAPVPKEAIEARGMTSLLLSGGTNDTVGDFEVILDASVVEFNIVEENDVPTSSSRVGNYTQKETINGVVYLVTRTRFPDGTTAVISSVPEV